MKARPWNTGLWRLPMALPSAPLFAQPVFTGDAVLDFALSGSVRVPDSGGKDISPPSTLPPGTTSELEIFIEEAPEAVE